MEIAAEVWFWVAPKATGTARLGRKARLAKGARGGRPPACDTKAYNGRNVVERGINRLEDFRAVCTRFDKRGHNYDAGVLIFCIMLWL